MPTRGGFLGILLLAGSLSPLSSIAQRGGGGGSGRSGGLPGGGAQARLGGGLPRAGGQSFTAGYGAGSYGRDRGGPPPGSAPDSAGTTSTMRGGLQIGPPGRWWDDKHFAKDLKLRPDQQRHMDEIFEANRAALVKRFGDLQQEKNKLESLTRAKAPDENAMYAQIDRVSQATADLEKAYTHYLLQIRGEMDTDQMSRLEDHR